MLALLLLEGSSQGLPDVSMPTVAMLIASVFLVFGAWSLYDRMVATLPNASHCAVCGTRLPRLQVIRTPRGSHKIRPPTP